MTPDKPVEQAPATMSLLDVLKSLPPAQALEILTVAGEEAPPEMLEAARFTGVAE